MQRSHCENENVQFIQELAEVDGPFESPININFKDLTKLELPPLVWNRAEVSPKKMKITNTGHTVIISGKWKCERPYLTGGPLSGKYVFSQIHFHWGQDDCKGSEHQVCGEGFPLEMHVAHFKTEYLTQECALREKDGMVVLVYLFKLQDEPNASLKKILNLLPCVKQASTSHAIDPKPILSLCNPFTDDYFLYWGSVVTSTCAHILLWIISREPFGISREQVNEFRKILDTSHQPICRNSRDTQPLHRRNVFHVNASKYLNDALLPIKKVLGCYCERSEEVSSISATNACNCQGFMQNQEDVEDEIRKVAFGLRDLSASFETTAIGYSFTQKVDFVCTFSRGTITAWGLLSAHWRVADNSGCYSSFIMRTADHLSVRDWERRECLKGEVFGTATIHSVPTLVKRFGSEPVRNVCCLDDLKQTKSEGYTLLNSASKSCCFLTTKEVGKIKNRTEKRKVREKKNPFNSVKAFSQLMDSLEAIKNQTFKKLKEIESINQEIKGMKTFCQDSEDKRWLRRIERIISRQKRFTLKSSQGCFSELKKLARECNFDKFFDGKALQEGDHNQKMIWLNYNGMGNEALPYSYNYLKGEEIPKIEMASSKHVNFNKAIKFSAKAQKLIQSFFEDIKESDDLQETVKKDLNIKKIESFCRKSAGDSNSVSVVNKGFITQKMFTLGNLGDRFFTAVSTDDLGVEENKWLVKRPSEEIMQTVETEESLVKDLIPTFRAKTEEGVTLHRNNVSTEVTETLAETVESVAEEQIVGSERKGNVEDPCDSESPSRRFWSSDDKSFSVREYQKQSMRSASKELFDLKGEKLPKRLQAKMTASCLRRSSSDLSKESMETYAHLFSRIRKRLSRKDLEEEKPSVLFTRVSSKGLSEKNYKKQKLKNVNFGGYCMKKKKLKKKKSYRRADKMSWDLTSTSKEETKIQIRKSSWRLFSKAKFRLELEKSSESTLDYAIEGSPISPERKKLKLENKKSKAIKENKYQSQSNDTYSDETERETLTSRSNKYKDNDNVRTKTENLSITETKPRKSKSAESQQGAALKVTYSQVSVNQRGVTSRTSLKKTVSSIDSRESYLKKQHSKMPRESQWPSPKPFKRDFYTVASPKLIKRNRSLNSITSAAVHSPEINHRVFVESLTDRWQSSEFRKKTESPMKSEERAKLIIIKKLSSETPNKKSDEDGHQKDTSPENAISNAEYNVEFFTVTTNQIDEKLLPKTYLQEGEGVPKMGESKKYQLHEMGLQEDREDFPEAIASKDDPDLLLPPLEDPLSLSNNELQATNSCSPLKNNSTAKHISVDSLLSRTKSKNLKYKKRLHRRKRSSKHQIRKNSSVLKKPKKVDSKQLPLLNLTDEEQINIISANVAKYLKQKLVEQTADINSEKKCSLREIKEVVYNNLVASQEKAKETPLQDSSSATKEAEKKHKKAAPEVKVREKIKKQEIKKPEKKQENREESSDNKPADQPKKEKTTSPSPKPVHNFIKRNKQMAGKYKRMTPPNERPPDPPKKEEETPKEKTEKVKQKPQFKKKDKGSPKKQDNQIKSTSEGTSSQMNQKLTEKPKKGSRIKSPRTLKKPDSKNQNTKKKPESPKPETPEPETHECESPKKEIPEPETEPKPVAEAEQPNQLVECENNPQPLSEDSLPSPIVIQKMPPPKKRLVPAYMLTSYLTPPIEIVQSQKRKMNKYLLGMNETNLDGYFPEVFQEVKNRKAGRSDPVFDKELEYLIKLQMCLNDEITSNIENSMNYVKTLFSPDYTPPYFDSGNSKGIVLVEMKDLDCSSSGSDFTEDLTKYGLGKEKREDKSDSNLKCKQVSCTKMPKESGDSGTITPLLLQEAQENSDSSYDCKISITLNPNAKESEGEMQNYDTLTFMGEHSNSQTTIYLEGSSSQSTVTKPHRKKRKENEISMEMKQKLLEILEGEIKREIGIAGGVSSEIFSDAPAMKWEDSDGNNRSQSTESSCDNMEMLTQISETMKQYLSDFKELRLEEIITESSDKESRDDE